MRFAGEIIKNPDDMIKDLWKMHEMRGTTRLMDAPPAIHNLWKWYCTKLMTRCARKNWEWGDDKHRTRDHFSKCVWPGDEAFVMANLEAKIEHYCEVRKSEIQDGEKKKRGRARGQKRDEKASPKTVAKNYIAYRKKITLIRQKAGMIPQIQDEEVSEVNNIRYSWDEWIRVQLVASAGDKREAPSGQDFNDLVLEEDGLS